MHQPHYHISSMYPSSLILESEKRYIGDSKNTLYLSTRKDLVANKSIISCSVLLCRTYKDEVSNGFIAVQGLYLPSVSLAPAKALMTDLALGQCNFLLNESLLVLSSTWDWWVFWSSQLLLLDEKWVEASEELQWRQKRRSICYFGFQPQLRGFPLGLL